MGGGVEARYYLTPPGGRLLDKNGVKIPYESLYRSSLDSNLRPFTFAGLESYHSVRSHCRAVPIKRALNHRLNRRARTRVGLALLVGLVTWAGLPQWLSPLTRLLIGWNASVLSFLGLAYAKILTAAPEEISHTARRQDEPRVAILLVAMLAAVTSLVAIGFLLQQAQAAPSRHRAALIGLAGLTVITAWVLVHTLFIFHYAHVYYGDRKEPGQADRGLDFPGGERPDYRDFAYFTFCIAMTSQVSDVQVTSPRLRRLVWIHSLFSFAFYTVILALTINLVAGLIQSGH